MPAVPALDHPLIDEALQKFEQFASRIGKPAAWTKIQPLVDRYHEGLYRLVLVGEEKRGKSSFVAALLGQPDLVPIGPEPMTAAVFKIVYGPRMQHRVFFLPTDPDDPDGSRRAPLDVSPDAVADYGTDRGNPNNEKNVDFIAIEHPHPLLKAGLTIVDLPGLGGLKQEHGLLTLRYLPNADAAFFVVDSVMSAITRQETVTLEHLRGYTDHIIFVQTKIDAVSMLQWQSWRDRNLGEIEKRLGIQPSDIRYYPVSNVLKSSFDSTGEREDLDDSGFAPLLRLLEENLIPRKHDRLAIPMLAALVHEIAEASQPIENEIAIREASSTDELDRMETDLRQAQQDYEQWRAEKLPGIMARFREEFRDAEIESDRAIDRDLEPSEHGPIVGSLMRSLEDCKDLSAKQVAEQSGAINDSAVALCGQRLSEISSQFESQVGAAYDRAADGVGQAAQPLVIDYRAGAIDLPMERLKPRSRSSLWNLAMQGRVGAMGGAMAAGIVAHLLFPPLTIATIAATLFGAIFGASRSIREVRLREREQAEQQLRVLLVDTVRRLKQHGAREMRAGAEKTRNAMMASLTDMVTQRERDEKSAISAIADQRRRTREETASLIRDLKVKIEMARMILRVLRQAGVPLESEAQSSVA
jgi:GTP-binding protein EngB required for normal cell division